LISKMVNEKNEEFREFKDKEFNKWLQSIRIAICGDIGSGKTTLAAYLAKKYGMNHISIGDIMRSIAKRRGISLLELERLANHDLDIDKELDKVQKDINDKGKAGIIIDSRLAWLFIDPCIKIYLKTKIDVAAERIYKDIVNNRRSEESFINGKYIKSIDDVKNEIKKRKELEYKRFSKLYNINLKEIFDNEDNLKKTFDLIIDTSKYDYEHIEENLNELGKEIERYLKVRYISDKVLEKIKPKDEELIIRAKNFINKLSEILKSEKINAKPILGGSVAKNTYLSNDTDIDIFLAFNYERYKDKDDKISDIAELCLSKLGLPYKRLIGSRDYFRLKTNGLNIEVVPILDIGEDKDKAKNITDISPMHVKWFKKISNKFGKICDEVRLTKQFLKAMKAYGAESYIRGLSGHVVDILIVYYGNFYNLIKSAVRWKMFEVIDVEHYYKNNKEVLDSLNKSKISPLIVIDPIDKSRNAAAALSQEKFKLIKERCASFIANPSLRYFNIEVVDEKTIKRLKEDGYIIIKIKTSDGKEDIVGAKLLKIFKRLVKKLNDEEFMALESDWYWDKKYICYMWFKPKNYRLGEKTVKRGPPLEMKEQVEKFKAKNKIRDPNAEFFYKDGRIYAKIKRKWVEVYEMIKEEVRKIKSDDRLSKIIEKYYII